MLSSVTLVSFNPYWTNSLLLSILGEPILFHSESVSAVRVYNLFTLQTVNNAQIFQLSLRILQTMNIFQFVLVFVVLQGFFPLMYGDRSME